MKNCLLLFNYVLGIGNIDNDNNVSLFFFLSCATILMLKKKKKKLRKAEHQHETTQAHLCFTISLTHC